MTVPRIVPAGDSAINVEFEPVLDVQVNARAAALADAMQRAAIPGVRDVVPAHRTVTVFFDPLRTDSDALQRRIEEEIAAMVAVPIADRTPIRVPVCYGGEFGPDLEEVASLAGLSAQDVVRLHTSEPFRVFMLGFLPGFAYLGLLDARIAVPRRPKPRVRVPAGSVALAGRHTGILPIDTPSGWRLIGRTPIRSFDLGRDDPFLIKPGDRVQFFPIGSEGYERLRSGS
jgi:KipI family sensor histidine kinase inhibitor